MLAKQETFKLVGIQSLALILTIVWQKLALSEVQEHVYNAYRSHMFQRLYRYLSCAHRCRDLGKCSGWFLCSHLGLQTHIGFACMQGELAQKYVFSSVLSFLQAAYSNKCSTRSTVWCKWSQRSAKSGITTLSQHFHSLSFFYIFFPFQSLIYCSPSLILETGLTAVLTVLSNSHGTFSNSYDLTNYWPSYEVLRVSERDRVSVRAHMLGLV